MVVAITGGARGIGRATAEALLRSGHRVAIGDLDAAMTARAADELGYGCVGVELDVTDPASFERFIDHTESRLGPLDVLVNNAGIMLLATVEEEAEAATAKMLAVNVHGVVTGSRLAIARMRPRGRGQIVNVASTLGKAALPGAASYCATKHAVVGLSEGLRAELRGTGIEISVVMPGLVNTELGAGVSSIRGFATVEPGDVARAIAAAVEHPRFDVFVPRKAGTMVKVMALLPRRVREGLIRALKSDQVFMEADAAARARYDVQYADGDARVPVP